MKHEVSCKDDFSWIYFIMLCARAFLMAEFNGGIIDKW